MKVDRFAVTVIRSNRETTRDRHSVDPSEALLFVWELTREVYALSGEYDVESGLRRDLVIVQRP